MIHQFEPFFAKPNYWIEELSGRDRLLRKGRFQDSDAVLHYEVPRLAYRDVASNTNERTLISAVLPPSVFAGNTLIVETQTSNETMLFLVALFNSLTLDYVIRAKVTSHLSMFYMYQLPVPRLTAGDPFFDAIVPRAARLTCTSPAFADLWQAVMGEAWTPASGVTDAVARQSLRDELDALVAHLYGLSRADFAHILGGFPLVFPDDASGAAKKEALLQVYDRMKGRGESGRRLAPVE